MKNLFSAQGRMSRREYWTLYLKVCLILFAFMFIIMLIMIPLLGQEAATSAYDILIPLAILMTGAVIANIVMIIASIKRLHDTNKGGEYYLITLVPYLGLIFLVYWMLQKGTEGPNNYGDVYIKGV